MPQLHLADMRAQGAGTSTLYTLHVPDRRGETRYEVTIHGARKLVDSVFGKSGLNIDIDPDATEQDAAKRAQEFLAPYYERLDIEMREPWKIAAPRSGSTKMTPPKPARTVTVSLRRTSGKGTFWAIGTPVPVAWPAGSMIQFVLPRCFTGGAVSVPSVGNPNVLIRFNAPFAPVAASSLRPGLLFDAAGFTNAPWFHVYPWNQFPAVGPGPSLAFLSCWGFSLLPF